MLNHKLKCWGFNVYQELGLNDTFGLNIGKGAADMGDNLPFVSILGDDALFSYVYAGDGKTYAKLVNNERLYAWGDSDRGLLGVNLTDHIVQVGGSQNVTQFGGSDIRCCVLFDDAKVKCWGSGGFLGLENKVSYNTLDKMGDNLPFVDLGEFKIDEISIGRSVVWARSGGDVIAWGSHASDSYALGYGFLNARGDEPGEMGILIPKIKLVDVESTNRPTSNPTTASPTFLGEKETDVVEVIAGFKVTCVIFRSRKAKCFGDNQYGTLNQGDTKNRGDDPDEMGPYLPFIDFGSDSLRNKYTVHSIVASETELCAILLPTMELKCWGKVHAYQYRSDDGAPDWDSIGDEKTEIGDSLFVLNVAPGRSVKKIATGRWFDCAVFDDGSVKCWGFNKDGILGIESKKDALLTGNGIPFVNVSSEYNAIDIVCGQYHTCVLLENGRVKCWGSNSHGQIGLPGASSNVIGDSVGEMGENLPFLDFGTNATVLNVYAGLTFSCALFNTLGGQVKCWGYNVEGQLGQEDTLNRGLNAGDIGESLPFINFGTGRSVKMFSAGSYSSCALLDNYRVKCFGSPYTAAPYAAPSDALNRLGYLGVSTYGDEPNEMGDNLPYLDLNSFGRYPISVSCGFAHTCVLMNDYVPICFGLGNVDGELGIQTAEFFKVTGEPLYGLFSIFWKSTFVEEMFYNMPVTKLYAGGMGLVGPIPNAIGNATLLEVIDFSDNKLTSIPSEIQNIYNLTQLYLENNDFVCTCELLSWFGPYFSTKTTLKDWGTTACGPYNTYDDISVASIRVDPEAPCYHPYNVEIETKTSRTLALKWKYDWATYLPYDIYFDIDCQEINDESNQNFTIRTEILPSYRNRPDGQYQHRLDMTFTPYTKFGCIIYPIYVYYDRIRLITGYNPANEAEASTFNQNLKTKRRVRGPGSATIVFTTLPDAPESPPRNIRSLSALRYQLPLAWDVPAIPNCDPSTLFYTVKAGNLTIANVTSTSLAIVSGVTPLTIYEVTVQASNIYGSSKFSNPVIIETAPSCGVGQLDDGVAGGCVPCPDGQYSGVDTPRGTCTVCDDFLHEPNPNKTACIPCRPGTIVDGKKGRFCNACPSGTYRNATMEECKECPEEYPHTLDTGASDIKQCLTGPGFYMNEEGKSTPCPLGGDCVGIGLTIETIGIQKGYWRASNNTARILPCKHTEYCAGSAPISRKANKESRRRLTDIETRVTYCIDNHMGILCESCQGDKVIIDSKVGCTVCTNERLSLESRNLALVFVIIPICYVVAFAAYIRITKSYDERVLEGKKLEGASKIKALKYWEKLIEDGVKSLVNVLQICGLLLVQYQDRFDVSVLQSTVGLDVLSLNFADLFRYPCLFPAANPAYFNMAFVVIGTFWMVFCIHIGGFILQRTIFNTPGKRKHAERWFYRAKFMFLSFVHPSVSAAILKIFQCIDYGGSTSNGNGLHVNALKSDPTALCDTNEYNKWYTVAVVLAVTFIPSIPIYITWILHHYRSLISYGTDFEALTGTLTPDQLHELKKIEIFYGKYKPKYYLSGAAILVYQLLLTSLFPLFMVLANISQSRQLIVLLLFLILAFVTFDAFKPYKNIVLNITNLIRVSLLMFIVFCAILYGSDVVSTGNEADIHFLGQLVYGIIVTAGVIIALLPFLVEGAIPALRRYWRGMSIWDIEDTNQENTQTAKLVDPDSNRLTIRTP